VMNGCFESRSQAAASSAVVVINCIAF
jgi:hypothetical protein